MHLSQRRVKNIEFSLEVDPKDEKLLTKVVRDNSDEYIRRSLIKKYNKYYGQWKDMNVLLALLAFIGLLLTMLNWDEKFSLRKPKGETNDDDF